MKKILVLAICLLCTTFVFADDLPTIAICYNGTSATVDIPSDIASVVSCTSGTSSHVVISSSTGKDEYCYSLSGSTDNGSFTLYGSYKLTLKLAGVDITNPNGAAVDVECGKRVAVSLKDDTENNLVDCDNGSQKAAMYFKGHPEFKGGGTLNVTGNTAHAISAKEYIELKSSTGEINILGAVKDGFHCGTGKGDEENDFFNMHGGKVTISNCLGNGIDSSDKGTMTFDGGKVTIHSTSLDAEAINCDGTMTISGEAEIVMDGDYYEVNPHDYKYDMSVFASLSKSDSEVDYTHYQLGAFVGDECRGSAVITLTEKAKYANMRIYSNAASERVSFCAYNPNKQRENVALEHITFYSNAQNGTPSSLLGLNLITADIQGLATLVDKAKTSTATTKVEDISFMRNRILGK